MVEAVSPKFSPLFLLDVRRLSVIGSRRDKEVLFRGNFLNNAGASSDNFYRTVV